MNDNLLERYRHDPAKVCLEIEAAARRERARYVWRILEQLAKALLGMGRGRPAERPRPDPCGRSAANRTPPLAS